MTYIINKGLAEAVLHRLPISTVPYQTKWVYVPYSEAFKLSLKLFKHTNHLHLLSLIFSRIQTMSRMRCPLWWILNAPRFTLPRHPQRNALLTKWFFPNEIGSRQPKKLDFNSPPCRTSYFTCSKNWNFAKFLVFFFSGFSAADQTYLVTAQWNFYGR